MEVYNPCHSLRKKGSTSRTSLPVQTMVNALLLSVRQHNFVIRIKRLHKRIERKARAVLSEMKKVGIWEAWSYLANKVLIVNHDEL